MSKLKSELAKVLINAHRCHTDIHKVYEKRWAVIDLCYDETTYCKDQLAAYALADELKASSDHPDLIRPIETQELRYEFELGGIRKRYKSLAAVQKALDKYDKKQTALINNSIIRTLKVIEGGSHG